MSKLLYQESADQLLSEFIQVRKKTMQLFKPLRIEDAVMQSDSFGSPANWHIAHVTWFFQKILEKHGATLESESSSSGGGFNLEYLNSYYQQFGKILSKQERGKFPRPTVKQTLDYRSFIDKKITKFLKEISSTTKISSEDANAVTHELQYDIMLGMQHEMQHQELMVYDFQHFFERFPDPSDNYEPLTINEPPKASEILRISSEMVDVPGGIFEVGYNGNAFCYDNELPKHKVYLQPFKIDVAPVTNGEYMKFIEGGGYKDYRYWLADGWELVKEQQWNAPLYWVQEEEEEDDNVWKKKDFRGLLRIDPDEPVVNVSYYEADAYARWAGKRLPTEAEWEKAASWNDELQRKTLYPWGDQGPTPKHANLLESYLWAPSKVGAYPAGKSYYGCHQMIGDVWEWTSSEYVLYPGFRSKFSEYTDKWTINQKVLRGGCFATPTAQIRNTYRNYFKPHERILFAGFRCARDIIV